MLDNSEEPKMNIYFFWSEAQDEYKTQCLVVIMGWAEGQFSAQWRQDKQTGPWPTFDSIC